MFTGLIRTIGSLRSFQQHSLQITCQAAGADAILLGLDHGDSIAVDGICLTVTEVLPHGFAAAVSPETLGRTTLNRTDGDRRVNLEPSLRVGSKLGGHFVTGHIDGVGYLESVVQTDIAWEMSFRANQSVARYIVLKGSIAINGVSLTVADCDPAGTSFKVAVIPVTYAETNLQYLQPGSPVNLEGDVLGKYVEKFWRLGQAIESPSHQQTIEAFEGVMDGQVDQPRQSDRRERSEGVTAAFLAEHGFG